MSMKRAGRTGIYDPPRKVLTAIPGLKLVEMERIREYSWCCGAGGGVHEAFPEFAGWTARERIEEAIATGADALVTACPWCVRTFRDATADMAVPMPIYDLTDLALQSAGIPERAGA
jgi:Fe-S oxidoreductase